MIKIFCFGDSITLGEKDDVQSGWADRLKSSYFLDYLYSKNQEICLYNLGIAGETTDGLAGRFAGELCARSIKGQRNIVVFAYGINDIVIHKNKNLVPVEYFVKNLKYCVNNIKVANQDILLLSLLPVSDECDGVVNQYNKLIFNDDVRHYNCVLERLANELGCSFLDNYSEFTRINQHELLSADGIHPNAKGHERLYNKIKIKLMELISNNG